MSAGGALQEAAVVALRGIEELAGIYDGPPARAAFPYVAIDASEERDWGHKSNAGREVFVASVLWDEQPARLVELADRVEAQLKGVSAVAGWQLVSLQFVKRKIRRDVDGPWAAMIDFRARLLASETEE